MIATTIAVRDPIAGTVISRIAATIAVIAIATIAATIVPIVVGTTAGGRTAIVATAEADAIATAVSRVRTTVPNSGNVTTTSRPGMDRRVIDTHAVADIDES